MSVNRTTFNEDVKDLVFIPISYDRAVFTEVIVDTEERGDKSVEEKKWAVNESLSEPQCTQVEELWQIFIVF